MTHTPIPRRSPVLRPGSPLRHVGRRVRFRGTDGQTTAEYALVILGAAGLATLLIAWATKSDAVGRLFDSVVDKILP